MPGKLLFNRLTMYQDRLMALRLLLVAGVAAAFSSFVATSATSAPVDLHVLAQPFAQLDGDGAIFNGASLEAVYRVDTSVLSPTSSGSGANQGGTYWPNIGTIISLKISGSASIDGVYPAVAQFDSWILEYNAIHSMIDTPSAQFTVGGFAIFLRTGVQLARDFFAGGPVPIHPKPFNASAVQSVDFVVTSNSFRFIGGNKSAFATTVPEPGTASLAACICAIPFCSRRLRRPQG
jgi:hypothetical protein